MFNINRKTQTEKRNSKPNETKGNGVRKSVRKKRKSQ